MPIRSGLAGKEDVMQATSKLGADRSINGLIPSLVALVSIALVWAVLGRDVAFVWTFLVFCAFTVLASIAYLRTRSNGYLATTLYALAASLMLAVRIGLIPGDREVAPAFAILLMVSVVILVFMLLTKQVKWRGRDLLELAALPVDGAEEGYSDRPRPIGRTDFTREEILDFAQFARRKLIAMTYTEPDRTVFVPVKMGTEFGYLFNPSPDYLDETWVAFEDDGHVTVNISQADYFAYRNDLDFDQLCQSLGDVFLGFLGLHRRGNEGRIVNHMNAMKVGVLS